VEVCAIRWAFHLLTGPKVMTSDHLAWVVPCFEEAARIDGAAFLALAEQSAPASLIFVDDGSRDQTLALLRGLAEQRPAQVEVVALPENRGKAEAVRRGMLRALAGAADVIGYVDADLATPPHELQRLAALVRGGDYDVLMGSRVQLLGHDIARKPIRHYIGRVFATCASLSLGLPVYDTQCGAKLFRRTPALASALAQPFTSRWAFDVELLARLIRPGPGVAAIAVERICEEPLLAWSDVPGSKLGPAAALRSGLDLIRLGARLRRH
jgi:glycosyltransferase involved in cell wall biosynthesis